MALLSSVGFSKLCTLLATGSLGMCQQPKMGCHLTNNNVGIHFHFIVHLHNSLTCCHKWSNANANFCNNLGWLGVQGFWGQQPQGQAQDAWFGHKIVQQMRSRIEFEQTQWFCCHRQGSDLSSLTLWTIHENGGAQTIGFCLPMHNVVLFNAFGCQKCSTFSRIDANCCSNHLLVSLGLLSSFNAADARLLQATMSLSFHFLWPFRVLFLTVSSSVALTLTIVMLIFSDKQEKKRDGRSVLVIVCTKSRTPLVVTSAIGKARWELDKLLLLFYDNNGKKGFSLLVVELNKPGLSFSFLRVLLRHWQSRRITTSFRRKKQRLWEHWGGWFLVAHSVPTTKTCLGAINDKQGLCWLFCGIRRHPRRNNHHQGYFWFSRWYTKWRISTVTSNQNRLCHRPIFIFIQGILNAAITTTRMVFFGTTRIGRALVG